MTKKSNDKPTPVRLRELKVPLHEVSIEQERSMQFLIRRAVREFLTKIGKIKA